MEFVVAEQVHLCSGVGMPGADLAEEGAPGEGVQAVFDLPKRSTGEFLQVGP